MLSKSLEFKNNVGQKIKIVEIPVLEVKNSHYFMIQVRLQNFVSYLYDKPQDVVCFSFRDYLKHKIKWADYKDLYSGQEFKDNA